MLLLPVLRQSRALLQFAYGTRAGKKVYARTTVCGGACVCVGCTSSPPVNRSRIRATRNDASVVGWFFFGCGVVSRSSVAVSAVRRVGYVVVISTTSLRNRRRPPPPHQRYICPHGPIERPRRVLQHSGITRGLVMRLTRHTHTRTTCVCKTGTARARLQMIRSIW